MTKFPLIPTTQFGGHNMSSTLDTGLTLIHNIQLAHQAGLYLGLLMFNIERLLDNINHERLIQMLEDLGFTLELVK